MKYQAPKNHERLLRHREKMQRKFDEACAKETCFWLMPATGPFYEPRFKDPLYLWFDSQKMHQIFKDMEVQNPNWKKEQDEMRERLIGPKRHFGLSSRDLRTVVDSIGRKPPQPPT